MTTQADAREHDPRDGLRGFATKVARLVVAQHLAQYLPDGHTVRTWAAPRRRRAAAWPDGELAPACVVSVTAPPEAALEELAAIAAAGGLRVQRYVDAAGRPACTIAAERFDGDEMLLETLRVVGWRAASAAVGRRLHDGVPALDVLGSWPFPVPVANVIGETVDGLGCSLHVRVECAGTPHGALRRRLPAVLSRFVARSAACGVSVAVGPWGTHRPVPVIRLGRRRERGTSG